MKLTKKLIPALGMLVLSASMLVTSTFAWFSMNTKVDVEGLTVKAVGDQVYLQIVKHEAGFTPGLAQTEYTYGADGDETANDKSYVPTNVYSSFDKTSPDAFDTSKNLVWVTATSANPAESAVDANGYKEITTGHTAYYYKTFYDLRLDPAAGIQDGGKLKVTSVAFASTPSDPIAESVCILIVCGNNKILYEQSTLGTWGTRAKSATTLTDSAFPGNGVVTTVDIYVFFNGDHSTCKTANVKPNAYAVNVTFNVNTDPVSP